MLETSCHQKWFQLESQRLSLWTLQSSGIDFSTPIKPRPWLRVHCWDHHTELIFIAWMLVSQPHQLQPFVLPLDECEMKWWQLCSVKQFTDCVEMEYCVRCETKGRKIVTTDFRLKRQINSLKTQIPYPPPKKNSLNCPIEWRLLAAFKTNFANFGQVSPWIQT